MQSSIININRSIRLLLKRFDFIRSIRGSIGSINKYFLNITSYNHCIQLDYKFTAAWNNKGEVLNSLGRYDEALEV